MNEISVIAFMHYSLIFHVELYAYALPQQLWKLCFDQIVLFFVGGVCWNITYINNIYNLDIEKSQYNNSFTTFSRNEAVISLTKIGSSTAAIKNCAHILLYTQYMTLSQLCSLNLLSYGGHPFLFEWVMNHFLHKSRDPLCFR